MSTEPQIKNDAMYLLLREENVPGFNEQRSLGLTSDLSDCDFRGLDLRGLHAAGLDLSGAYFRNTDIRGVDFCRTNLQGASLKGAKISGCLFPDAIRAEELLMSVVHGTRIRYA